MKWRSFILSFPSVPGAPLRALRGFERVHLEPGASQTVHFELKPRDLSMVTEAGEPIVAEGAYTVTWAVANRTLAHQRSREFPRERHAHAS